MFKNKSLCFIPFFSVLIHFVSIVSLRILMLAYLGAARLFVHNVQPPAKDMMNMVSLPQNKFVGLKKLN